MTTEDAFVAAIVESPDDDNLRLIFADWLEERGDPRAEFIRVQIELSALEGVTVSRLRDELIESEVELLNDHEEEWVAPLSVLLPGEFCTPVFHRGMIEEVTFWGGSGARHFLACTGELFQRLPIRQLRLRPIGGQSRSPFPWVHTPAPDRDRMSLDELRQVLKLPQLSRLTCLDLSATEIEETTERALMITNIVGDEGARMIGECSHLRGLRTLVLRGCGIGDGGASLIIESTYLKSLSTLDLSLNPLRPGMMSWLRELPRPPEVHV